MSVGKSVRKRAKEAEQPVGEDSPEKQQSERLIRVEANRLVLLTLKEMTILLSDRIEQAGQDIGLLSEERLQEKSFASYRDINALRKLNEELHRWSGLIGARRDEIRDDQSRLTALIRKKT